MKKIIIRATGFGNWIGGLYYVRNVAYQLYSNSKLQERIYVLVNEENEELFDFLNHNRVCVVKNNNKKDNDKELLRLLIKFGGGYVFPGPRFRHFPSAVLRVFNITPINWIPDFQQCHLPQFFPRDQYAAREEDFKYVIDSSYPLILSSKDSYKDLSQFYTANRDKTYVMHFVSYIEGEVLSISQEYADSILQKYGLLHVKYACVMNQFWEHKNHLVVLNALKEYYSTHQENDFKFAFTGQLFDNRNPDYIEKIKLFFEDPVLKENLVLLGFIDRKEQLALMKNSEYIIQPSLFEGWGTVVEDAKVLDKTIILSDIPIHREQKNDKCIMFDPQNTGELLNIIIDENQKTHCQDINFGIEDMKKRARLYSESFEKLIAELEKK